MGVIAIFIAVTGTAYGAAANSIGSRAIKNDTVRSVDVRDNNLTGADILESSLNNLPPTTPDGPAGGDLNGAYPNPDVGPNAIGAPEVQPDSLTAGDLAPNSVDSSEIAANAVGLSEIATGAVGINELAPSSVRASKVGDGIFARTGAPVNVPGGIAENGAYDVR